MRNPDEDDWKKLRRMIGYLKITIKSPLLLRANGVNVLKWWVDASYVPLDDIWGHTGGNMSMGKDGHGSITSISKKQKLSKKSLTEA